MDASMIPDTVIIEMVRAFPAVVVLVHVAWRQEKLIRLVVAACMRHLEEDASRENSDT